MWLWLIPKLRLRFVRLGFYAPTRQPPATPTPAKVAAVPASELGWLPDLLVSVPIAMRRCRGCGCLTVKRVTSTLPGAAIQWP